MRLCALILAACAASTLNWSGVAHSATAAREQRLPHISVTTVGEGSPIVLIPGLSTPRTIWDGVVPQLAAKHRVILVQVNGFAGDAPGSNLSPGVIDGAVADLHAYIAANKLTGAKIVGHSLGGLMALDLARLHPEDASALMIVDALPYVGDTILPGATVAQVEPQARAMRDQITASYGKEVPGVDGMAATMAATPAAQAKVAAWMKGADSRVAAEALYEDLTMDLRPDMTAIKTPITLVYPISAAMPKERADPFYRAEYARAPNVTYVPVTGSAHFIMLDQPQAFAAALADFAGLTK